MPLWAAALFFIIGISGAGLSFRAYSRGGKKFLAIGIAISLLCFAALLYAAAVLLFVSSIP